jgi:ferredoxin-type protein NapG
MSWWSRWLRRTSPQDSEPQTPTPPQPPPDPTPIDRAAFLREGKSILKQMSARLGHTVLGAAADRIAPSLVRPPGAIPEEAFFSQCTRCDACIEACHQEVILRADGRLGIHIGTPYLDVQNHRPCYLCLTPPCAAACPTGALLPIKQADIHLGTAEIITETCLPWNAKPCSRCAAICPIPSAILTADDGRVIVDPDLCVGCGMCLHACPTDPPSLRILPNL